jgi:hypothetical protein
MLMEIGNQNELKFTDFCEKHGFTIVKPLISTFFLLLGDSFSTPEIAAGRGDRRKNTARIASTKKT